MSQVHDPDNVLVIDNGSTDNTREVISKFPEIRVIYDADRRLSELLNRGWKESASDIVGFLNDDTVVTSMWVEDVKTYFARLRDAAAIGGPTIDVNPRRIAKFVSGNGIIRKFATKVYDVLVLQGRLYDYGLLTPWGAFSIGTQSPTVPVAVSTLTITNMAVKREVLDALNGFDESFSFQHIDGFFFISLLRKGFVMYAIPGAGVRHYPNPTGRVRSAYNLALDQAVFEKKLRPTKTKDKLLLRLNSFAFFAFWILSNHENRVEVINSILRGYLDGSCSSMRFSKRE